MASRQARLEPLALSASGHERMVNGRAAASGGENGLDFPQESPGSVHNKIEGPLGQIGPIRSFAIRLSVAGSSQRRHGGGKALSGDERMVNVGGGEWGENGLDFPRNRLVRCIIR